MFGVSAALGGDSLFASDVIALDNFEVSVPLDFVLTKLAFVERLPFSSRLEFETALSVLCLLALLERALTDCFDFSRGVEKLCGSADAPYNDIEDSPPPEPGVSALV